jgi:hypothetical protein
MKFLAVVLFVITNIQKQPASWALLPFKTWPIFVLSQMSVTIYMKCARALGNKAMWGSQALSPNLQET